MRKDEEKGDAERQTKKNKGIKNQDRHTEREKKYQETGLGINGKAKKN